MRTTLLEEVGGRWSVVTARLAVDALSRVAPVIDALGAAASCQGVVREGCPSLARPFHPGTAVQAARLRRTPTCGVDGVCPSEPSLPIALDAVVHPFRNEEVRVRVVRRATLVASGMNGQRVGKLFRIGELMDESSGERHLVLKVQPARQGEVCTDVQPTVGTLEEIRGIPIRFW